MMSPDVLKGGDDDHNYEALSYCGWDSCVTNSNTWVAIPSDFSDHIRRASSFLFPRRLYITYATTQANVLPAS